MLKRIASLALLLTLVGTPVGAQGRADGALLDMLRHVPADAVETGGLVTYVDLRGVEAARPGASTPSSYQVWQDWRDNDAEAFDQWVAAFRGVNTGALQLMREFPDTGGDWPSVVGFDFFDVDRLVSFGIPPEDAVIAAGRFDTGAIASAHRARGFRSKEQGGGTLICSKDGCDDGLKVDLGGREPADPFGGVMGRKQPLVVTDDTLLSSASYDAIKAMQAADSGESLAQVPQVLAALATLPDDALLRQATFVSPDTVGGAGSGEEPTLPPYELLLFADSATATEQIANVVLVYDSSEDAQTAAEVLPVRLAEITFDQGMGSSRDQLEERGLTAVDVDVLEAPDGSSATVDVTLRAPLAGLDASSLEVPSSALYEHLISLLYLFEAGWLASPAS